MEFSVEMSRRKLMERAMLLVGATVAVGGCKMVPGDGADPNFKFSEAQFKSLTALADTIVPKGDSVGALDAKVPKTLENLIRGWASSKTRDRLVAAIEEVGALGEGGDFAALDPAARLAALTPYDADGLKPSDKPPEKGAMSFMMGPAPNNPGYAKLRQLIIYGFYYSETALTNELEYEHNPGKWEPSVPLTPETRQQGGLGFM